MPSTETADSRDFPRTLADLTLSWLSEVLSLPISRVNATEIGQGKGMLGDVWWLRLDVRERDSLDVVAKFSAIRNGTLPVARRAEIFDREINFYRTLAPYLGCRLPHIYGTWHDKGRAEFLILMEFIHADVTVDQKKGVSFERAVQVMDELAVLHAFDLAQNHTIADLADVVSVERRTNHRLFIANGWDQLRELLGAAAVGVPNSEDLQERITRAYDTLTKLPRVLCHGDVRPDNLLFDTREDSVVLIDWQGVAVGPRAWDIAYFLAQALTVEDRRDWQGKLLTAYVVKSVELGQHVEKSDLETTLGGAAWFSLAVACGLFTVADTSQPATLALAASMGERTVRLLQDENQF